jgi:hypothetical protein
MLSRQTFLRTALVTSVAAIALSGCGMMRPSNKMQIFEANLSASQEVPPAVSSGSGQGEVMYNENTGMLSWKVTYSGLTGPATAAHIHGPAAVGANAGVVVPFPGDLNAQPITGERAITPAQYADLAAGLYYVNIHSARFPGGEIRGQLRRRGGSGTY